jgi:hypothetical protein
VGKPVNGALQRCNAWREDVTRRLLAARPSLVVVAEYDSVPVTIVDNTTQRSVSGDRAAATFRAGLIRQLARLRAAGIPVVLVRDNPRFAASGPKCVLAHAKDLAQCARVRAQALPVRTEEEAVAAVPGVNLLDVNDRLCDGPTCRPLSGHVLAYRDDNHLTIEFVLSEVARLGAAADAASHG